MFINIFISTIKYVIFILSILYIIYYIDLYNKCSRHDKNHIIYSFICLILSFLICISFNMIFRTKSMYKYLMIMSVPFLCFIISYLYVDYQMNLYNNCIHHNDIYNIYYKISFALIINYLNIHFGNEIQSKLNSYNL